MFQLWDEAKEAFRAPTCNRTTLAYDEDTFKIHVEGGETVTYQIPLSSLPKPEEKEEIHSAFDFIENLYDYDYRICRICKNLDPADEQWTKYSKVRLCILQNLFEFRHVVSDFERDQSKRHQLLNAIMVIRGFYRRMDIEAKLFEKLNAYEAESKGNPPKITEQIVSSAIIEAKLDKHQVDEFMEELK